MIEAECKFNKTSIKYGKVAPLRPSILKEEHMFVKENVRKTTRAINPEWDWLSNFGDLCNSTKKLGVTDDTRYIGINVDMTYVTDRYGKQITASRIC